MLKKITLDGEEYFLLPVSLVDGQKTDEIAHGAVKSTVFKSGSIAADPLLCKACWHQINNCICSQMKTNK